MKRIYITSVAAVITTILLVIMLLYPQSTRYTATLIGLNLVVEVGLLLYMNWKKMDL